MNISLLHSVVTQATAAITTQGLVAFALAASLTTIACLIFYFYPAFPTKAIGYFHAVARHANLCILAAALLPLILRLLLLPLVRPPEPRIADEFGHLLIADTLAAGRLANPPHTLWRHLETIYVLQQPTFASKYPIGQGAILAVGKVLMGHPWAGVLLAVGLMSGAITWMFFGCLPPAWAAMGGLLAAFLYGLAPQWIDSYWGGAFCAFGGGLLFGALCRLRRSPSKSMAMTVGVGWSIVWLIRPFESLLLLVISWILIAAFINRNPPRRRWLGPTAIIGLIQLFGGLISALHNHAVTGSFTTLPYQLSQRVYGVPQSLLWQKPIEEPPLRFAELKAVYLWQRGLKDQLTQRPFHHGAIFLYRAWEFFVTPWYSLPIVLLIFLLKDKWIRLGAGIMACALIASALYPFFFPHYLAAYSCIIMFLIIRGLMALNQWSHRGRAVGHVIVLFLVVGGSVTSLLGILPIEAILSRHFDTKETDLRVLVIDRLLKLGGRHVVFVRYEADHSFHDEWVFNAANIDAAPIVWCRATESDDASEVTRYYKDRHFWIASVGANRVRISRYNGGLQPNVSTEAPAREQQEWIFEKPRIQGEEVRIVGNGEAFN
jgi:hypothetical protein